MSDQKPQSKNFISAKLLDKAKEAKVANVYRAADVLNNIKRNEEGVYENLPIGMLFAETRTANGFEGAFIEPVKED